MDARTTLFLLAIALLQHPRAFAKEPAPAPLTAAQRSSLMRVTCDAHGTSATAEVRTWRATSGRTGIGAAVLCQALPAFRSVPVFRRYTCETGNGKAWTCGEKLRAIRMTIYSRQVLVMYSKGLVSPAIAMQITRYIGEEHPLTFNGHNLREMMLEGECRVTPAGAGAMAGSTNYLLACGQRRLIVGRLCIERRCRAYPVSYTAPAPP